MVDDSDQVKSNSPERRKWDRSYIEARKTPEKLKEMLHEVLAENRLLCQELKKKRIYRFVNTSEETRQKLAHQYPRRLHPDEPTLELIASHARIQCTDVEFAAALQVSLDYWKAFKADFPEVQQAIDNNRGTGKISLRRKQWKMALEDGHWGAIQHLSKHALGEHDKAADVNITVNNLTNLLGTVKTVDSQDFVDTTFEEMKQLAMPNAVERSTDRPDDSPDD